MDFDNEAIPSKRSSLTQTGTDNDDKDLNTFLITWTWKAWEFKGQLQKVVGEFTGLSSQQFQFNIINYQNL